MQVVSVSASFKQGRTTLNSSGVDSDAEGLVGATVLEACSKALVAGGARANFPQQIPLGKLDDRDHHLVTAAQAILTRPWAGWRVQGRLQIPRMGGMTE